MKLRQDEVWEATLVAVAMARKKVVTTKNKAQKMSKVAWQMRDKAAKARKKAEEAWDEAKEAKRNLEKAEEAETVAQKNQTQRGQDERS